MPIAPRSDELVRLIDPGHRYVVGEGLTEREAPSLSQVIANGGLSVDYSGVDPVLLGFRARVGTLVHSAIEGCLSEPDADHQLTDLTDDPFLAMHASPHFEAFLEWWSRYDVVPAYCEVPAYNPVLKYACTADFVGYLDGCPWVIDWKTTSRVSKSVALQTMGQADCFKFVEDERPRRGALHLPKKGKARIVEFKDDQLDGETLRALATCWNNKGRYL